MTTDKKVICELARLTSEDLLALKELFEAGKLEPVIDRCYPLARAAEAHRFVEAGSKVGHVVLTVGRG